MQITFKHSLCFLARSFLLLLFLLLLYLFVLLFRVALVFFFFSYACNGRRETETVVATAAGGHKKERDETRRRDALRWQRACFAFHCAQATVFFFSFYLFFSSRLQLKLTQILTHRLPCCDDGGGRMRIAVRFGDRLDRLLWGLAAVKASLWAPLSSLPSPLLFDLPVNNLGLLCCLHMHIHKYII